MNKKIFIILLSIFILVASLYFVLQPKKHNNEVVFWTLQMNDFAPYINGVINEFETLNPNIKIKWVDVPFSEGEKRTLASVLSDNPPDLVNLNPDFSATLAQKGALQEIPKEKMSQYKNSIIEALTYNNKIYSIPWYATSAITIYNKEILKQSGLPLAKNYKEISSNASSVKEKTNAFIILPNITENDTMLKILNKYGIANSQKINSPKAIEVFEMFKYLYNQNLIPKETVTMTLQESLEKYMSGNILMLCAGANFLNMIKENAPATYKKTDVATQITGELGQYDFSLMNFVIPLKATHKEEALAFAIFLTNEKNQLELAKLTNVLAVNEKALQNEIYTKYDKNDLTAKARVISANQLNKIKPMYKTQKNQKEINNIINSATQEILLGKKNVKDALNKASLDWKKLEE